ncbi:Tat (twin-arginine translocation) pathway signal sequence domain protein [Burkholderia cenocepacia]|nr:Tat (twin-arginine translocation) pathway signal sequence domain protein [Burkholderia cenocepacia]
MNRRDFLTLTGAAAAAGVSLWQPPAGAAPVTDVTGRQPAAGYANVLILVELKGGNDGLNTVVPYADPLYYEVRRSIGVKRDQVLQLDAQTGLHPALAPLMPLWRDAQVAIVQGVGYPQPNLSHFRSIEIWDTASRADQYLHEGWLTRTFAQAPVPPGFAADGVVLGSAEMGPLANGARAIALVNPAQFIRAARLAEPSSLREQNPALAHIIDVENDIVKAADRLRPRGGMREFRTAFPAGTFGTSVKTAMQVLAACEASGPGAQDGVAVLRLTLNGFDTHQNQPGQHAALLKQFAEGMSAMRGALIELGRWNQTLVMTYAEFGRRVRENQSNGTDHGTAAPHFVMGGRVAGGLYGARPALARVDGNGNLPVAVDFRQLYATVLGPWWGLDATRVLQQRFDTLPLLRA